MTREQRVNIFYANKPRPETVGDIDFAREFPFVLNAQCGGIEFVRDHSSAQAPVTRKPANHGKGVVRSEGRIPVFGNLDYVLFGALGGIPIFCACLRLAGIW